MKAIVYSQTGGSDVLRLVERPEPVPGAGEVRVRVAVSGVNPTDWKTREGSAPDQPLAFPEVVPNQDGAGVIDAVGAGVDPARIGERVWLWQAAWGRSQGSAAEWVTIPQAQAVVLPAGASFDLGASLGIPAMTAHRCLTVGSEGPDSLSPGTLDGRLVLVAGGAGAVGHAAIELASWAGATVIATVSSPEKGDLARRAGAHHVINYRSEDVAATVRTLAPDGVSHVVEVSPAANADLDAAVLARNATVAAYATDGGPDVTLAVRRMMNSNVRYQFVLVYTLSERAKHQAVAEVGAAVQAGVLRVGAGSGLPLHRYALEQAAQAHDAVRSNTVGKVLIDVSQPPA